MRSRYSRWGLVALLTVAAALLLAIGVRGLLSQGSELPEALRPREFPVATPVLTVLPTPASPSIPEPTVNPTAPSTAPAVRMVIESLGIDAPVMTLGLDKDLVPEVPTMQNTPRELGHPKDVVAWYNFSKLPGHGSNAVFSGHVDWLNSLGVYGRLRDLKPDDVIQVFLADDTVYRYTVLDNLRIPWDDPEAVKLLLETDDEVVTLVTCGGSWVPDRNNPLGGNYSQRIFVRAARILDHSSSVEASTSY